MNLVLGLPYFEYNECSINELSLRLPYFDSEA